MEPVELRRKMTSVDERFQVVTITFKPEVTIAPNDTVSILGEFSNWIPQIMERYDHEKVVLEPELANTFFYKTKLFIGDLLEHNPALNETLSTLKIENHSALREAYNLNTFPTLLVTGPGGIEMDRVVGGLAIRDCIEERLVDIYREAHQ